MNVVGIIVEYNPFHNGHLYHINKSKEITGSDICIAIISGNFVQRGMPAYCDKHIRTEMALKNGVDMVIELPVYYATSSAEYFAHASINILNSTGIVNNLCFGTEVGELDTLYKYANILVYEPYVYKRELKNILATGVSYPKARQEALKIVFNEDTSFIDNPNNILGLEYIKALIKTSSNIKAFTIKRYLANYHSTLVNKNIASATAIRNSLDNNNWDEVLQSTPKSSYELLKNLVIQKLAPVNIDAFSHIFHYILKNSTTDFLKGILDVDEGLENRIIAKANEHFEISKILSSLKSKRHTHTKLQRALLHILLNINKEDMFKYNCNGGPQYIRVLGFKKEAAFLLKEIKNKGSLPLLTNLKDANKSLNPLGISMLNKEITTTDIYYMGQEKYKYTPLSKNIEYTKPIVII